MLSESEVLELDLANPLDLYRAFKDIEELGAAKSLLTMAKHAGPDRAAEALAPMFDSNVSRFGDDGRLVNLLWTAAYGHACWLISQSRSLTT